jgi:hypothetical protein
MDQEFEVRKIIGRRVVLNELQYKVLWQGFSDE